MYVLHTWGNSYMSTPMKRRVTHMHRVGLHSVAVYVQVPTMTRATSVPVMQAWVLPALQCAKPQRFWAFAGIYAIPGLLTLQDAGTAVVALYVLNLLHYLVRSSLITTRAAAQRPLARVLSASVAGTGTQCAGM